ncbi:MAG: type II toxin-antitoxin system RelE/ParE family toxin [Chloroflexi bacterium]|nr:type II toxin-antitoxin system RelE/ParE family toxin [Chloroflexota bacterium]
MASFRLLIKPSAAKELEKTPKQARLLLIARIQALADSPRPPGCEKLAGQPYYRVRQGPYRVIYSVEDSQQTIVILKVGHRREVYR